MFTEQEINDLYLTKIKLPESYFNKYDNKIPKCPVKSYDYVWSYRDFPRNFCILDFIEWIKKHKIIEDRNGQFYLVSKKISILIWFVDTVRKIYNFINIDVQGYEPKVLDGAIETIKKHKPIIFIEVELPQLQIYGWDSNDVFNRLDALGYTYKKVIDSSHLVDYIAIPK